MVSHREAAREIKRDLVDLGVGVEHLHPDNSEFVRHRQKREIRLGDALVYSGQRPDLDLLLRAAVLCNEGDLPRRDGEWLWHGDPTDEAGHSVRNGLHDVSPRRRPQHS